MRLINKLTQKLQRHPKRIVYPDGTDHRILQAARQFATKRMGVPILVGERSVIKDTAMRLDISLENIRIIDPARSEDLEDFAEQLFDKRKHRGVTEAEALKMAGQPNYFASLMLANHQADALVFGAGTPASRALPSLFQTIPLQEDVKTASSMLILDIESKTEFGVDGGLFLADCAVLPNPDASQLADIAITTASLAYHLTAEMPRVALLSFSTKSSSSTNPSVVKMREATRLAREKAKKLPFPIEIDGEIQADTALDRYTAKLKESDGSVAGGANVLIFPDLNSGNIAAKMVTILAGAYSYGQIITGLSKPAAQVSRGTTAHDIFATTVIVGCQAIDHRLLFGQESHG